MHIAFLTPEYVTESNFDGGLANYLFRVSQAMKNRSHNVEIFTSSNKEETFFHRGIIVHRVEVSHPLINFVNRITRHKFKKSLHVLSLSYALTKKLLQRHHERMFDIVQVSNYLACGLFLTFYSPAPIVTRVSSYEPLWRKFYGKKFTYDQRFLEWLEIMSLRRSNAVYTPSEFLSNILMQKEHIKTDVIRPPFLLEEDNFDDSDYKEHLAGKKYLLFFGTVGLLKGGDILAQTLPRVLSEYRDMYFVFVGKDGKNAKGESMIEYIKEKANKYKDQIIYFGVLPHTKLFSIVKHSKGVVLPSLIDNFPNAMLEAMGLGKIVIGTTGTSFEDFISDGISGILIPPNSPLELAKAMKKLWNMSEEERKTIEKKAKECVSSLLPEITCNSLEKYFRNLSDKLKTKNIVRF